MDPTRTSHPIRRRLIPGPPNRTRERRYLELVARLGNVVWRTNRERPGTTEDLIIHKALNETYRDYLRSIEAADNRFLRALREQLTGIALLRAHTHIAQTLKVGHDAVAWFVNHAGLPDIDRLVEANRSDINRMLRSNPDRVSGALDHLAVDCSPRRRDSRLELYTEARRCLMPLIAANISSVIDAAFARYPQLSDTDCLAATSRVEVALADAWRDKDSFQQGPNELASAVVGKLLPAGRGKRTVYARLKELIAFTKEVNESVSGRPKSESALDDNSLTHGYAFLDELRCRHR